MNMRMAEAGRTIQQFISFLANLNGVDVDQLSLSNCILTRTSYSLIITTF
jgi:hypothetical protein